MTSALADQKTANAKAIKLVAVKAVVEQDAQLSLWHIRRQRANNSELLKKNAKYVLVGLILICQHMTKPGCACLSQLEGLVTRNGMETKRLCIAKRTISAKKIHAIIFNSKPCPSDRKSLNASIKIVC